MVYLCGSVGFTSIVRKLCVMGKQIDKLMKNARSSTVLYLCINKTDLVHVQEVVMNTRVLVACLTIFCLVRRCVRLYGRAMISLNPLLNTAKYISA